MAGYNRTRQVEELLERHTKSPPSFSVHLYPEHWSLNQGGKFLYNNQIASLLDDVRAHRIPVDFLELFEAAKVPFYDGCMIVELKDYRPPKSKDPTLEQPEVTRVVLHPNSETLWADLCSLNQRHGGKWTDQNVLEIEARILLATSPPLCLNPDPHLTRIANHVLRVSTPSAPVSLKRKAAALEPEEDETEKARRAKIMQFMAPRSNKPHVPNWKRFDSAINLRQTTKAHKPPTPAPIPPTAQVAPTAPPPPPTPQVPPAPSSIQFTASGHQSPSNAVPITGSHLAQAQSPADASDKKSKSKVPATFPKSQTPIPQSTVPQFAHQHPPTQANHPSPSTNAASPIQSAVYGSVHTSTEAAKRASTPAQNQAYLSPRAPTAVPQSQQPVHQPPPVQPRPPSVAPFQSPNPNPNPHFVPPSQITRSLSQKAGSNPIQPPQTNNHPMMSTMYTPSVQQQQAMLQQRIAQAHMNGRLTPQIPVKAASPAAHPSPVVASQQLPARSPMPQVSQQQQHPQQQLNAQQLYNAQIRSMTQNKINAQQLQNQLVNATRVTPSPHPPGDSSQVQLTPTQQPRAAQALQQQTPRLTPRMQPQQINGQPHQAHTHLQPPRPNSAQQPSPQQMHPQQVQGQTQHSGQQPGAQQQVQGQAPQTSQQPQQIQQQIPYAFQYQYTAGGAGRLPPNYWPNAAPRQQGMANMAMNAASNSTNSSVNNTGANNQIVGANPAVNGITMGGMNGINLNASMPGIAHNMNSGMNGLSGFGGVNMTGMVHMNNIAGMGNVGATTAGAGSNAAAAAALAAAAGMGMNGMTGMALNGHGVNGHPSQGPHGLGHGHGTIGIGGHGHGHGHVGHPNHHLAAAGLNVHGHGMNGMNGMNGMGGMTGVNGMIGMAGMNMGQINAAGGGPAGMQQMQVSLGMGVGKAVQGGMPGR